jgi:hypothetical protein
MRELAALRVVAHPPWGGEIVGTWIHAHRLAFHIDWARAGIAVLADDALARAARPWDVAGVVWQPTATDADRIVKHAAAATGTELTLVTGGPPPRLEVSVFEPDGPLSVGQPATLTVTLANHGTGHAYRVNAMTRSSMPALHGRRLEFGVLAPGTSKTRKLRVAIPSDVTAPDAMVLLVVDEGNGHTPEQLSRRWAIAPAKPDVTISCVIREHPVARTTVNLGESVIVRCIARNEGTAAALVTLAISLADVDVRSKPRGIASDASVAFDLPVTVPRDLVIGSTTQLVVTASDPERGRLAQTLLVAEVAKAKLCVAGQLSRRDYDAKLAELRAAVKAGDMTQAQLDRYDGELLLCLN